VIGTASAGNEAFLRELGVDDFINYRITAFESVVREVDVVVDSIPRESDPTGFTSSPTKGTNPPTSMCDSRDRIANSGSIP